MFSKLLVSVLVAVAFARPDVSHLKTVEYKPHVTSYDVPIKSINDKYHSTNYYRYGQQNVPTVTILPPLKHEYYTSGNVVPTLVSNTGSGQYGLLNRYGSGYGGQGYYTYGTGSSSGNKNQGLYFVNQGHGTGVGGTHFVSGHGHGTGHGSTHFVSGQGHGTGHGGTYFVTQPSVGKEVVSSHFVTQPVRHEIVNTQFVTQPVHHELVNTQFVSQPIYTSGHQQFVGHHYGTHGQGGGHIHVGHDAGIGHQQYVKSEENVYYFSAPEELQHRTRLRINVVPTHTKKSNVIFVNAPSSPQVIPEVVVPPNQIVEDKTKVVVLVKEHDQFVPITVQAPVPVNKGKAEVFVVKYHDKHDAEQIISGTGKVYGSTLIQQDRPGFVHNLEANVVKHYGGSTVAPTIISSGGSSSGVYGVNTGAHLVNVGSQGTHSVNIVDTTPKIYTHTVGNLNADNLVGGKQTVVKTVETVTTAPKVATIGKEGDLSLRFGSDVDGLGQSGYTVQTTDFVQNLPNSDAVGYDNINKIRNLLGSSGQGIDIVSISKGTLEGSAAGPQAQEQFFKSLGLDSSSFEFTSDAIPHDGSSFARTFQVTESPQTVGDLPLQVKTSEVTFDSPKEIHIGSNIADVIKETTLSP